MQTHRTRKRTSNCLAWPPESVRVCLKISKEPSEEGPRREREEGPLFHLPSPSSEGWKRGEGGRGGEGFFRHTLSMSDGTRLLPTFCWAAPGGASSSNEWKP